MPFHFPSIAIPPTIPKKNWNNWIWQTKCALTKREDFSKHFVLSKEEEEGFLNHDQAFNIRVTPYYKEIADKKDPKDPIRRIFMPHKREVEKDSLQKHSMDPLGEKKYSPLPRIVHRYPDRALFLVTDHCSLYCRYCTRKHFTGLKSSFIRPIEYKRALEYLKNKTSIREVILSGGDPLTLSNAILEKILKDLKQIKHIEILRIGSRMPVVNPMRIEEKLLKILKNHHPLFMMTHFNHPRELTLQASQALTQLVDHGIPVFNQMVLLNGINNHEAIVQSLSRRLLFLRVKPYYMFQCDPSRGTKHLRNSIENSLSIQKALWGKLSGLALPQYSIDIPGGGGKVSLFPDSILEKRKRASSNEWVFKGWDGIEGSYVNPESVEKPIGLEPYLKEWEKIQGKNLISKG